MEKNDWESYSAVIDPQDNDFSVVSGTAGYLFTVDRFIGAAGVGLRSIQPAVRAYMESYYAPGERWPARMLVQFNRKSGQYKVLFEESDKSRWKLTPRNMDAMYEELRPQC